MPKQKLYTVGQIGKKFKVHLSEVYKWDTELSKRLHPHGGRRGMIKIEGDKYGRYGFPEDLVKIFPHIPKEGTKLHQKYHREPEPPLGLNKLSENI